MTSADALPGRRKSLDARSTLRQAGSIDAAICDVFRCGFDPEPFGPRPGFAVRAWARRAKAIRLALDRSDAARVSAIRATFERHGFGRDGALARARVLPYTQIGSCALDIAKPMEVRLKPDPRRLEAFGGTASREEEIAAFRTCALSRAGGDR